MPETRHIDSQREIKRNREREREREIQERQPEIER